jgi:hypothetical protein
VDAEVKGNSKVESRKKFEIPKLESGAAVAKKEDE